MSVYGYIRVSIREQNEDRQIIAMQELQVPEAHLYIDKQSGKDFERPAYKRLMRRMKKNDVIYIKNFDPAETQHLDVMEDHSFVPASGIERCHGMHDGCVYIYTQDEISEDYEIVKISEGGNVEHISTGRPKP